MRVRAHILFTVSLVLLAGLACQTGQILTPEEATQRAEATRNPGGLGPDAERAEFAEGETVEFVSRNFLVNLYSAPGEARIEGNVARGQQGTILGAQTVEGGVWYLVETDAGEGWVNQEFLSRSRVAEEGEITGFEVGDRVYLTSTGFLVNFYKEAGGNRIVAGQERGALVTVLALEEVEGTIWYRIEGTTGTGWVPETNLTSEDPGS